jgi:hypothetical protein
MKDEIDELLDQVDHEVGGSAVEAGRTKKRQAARTACRKGATVESDVGLGLAETLHAIAGLPEAALLEQVDPLETLQDVAFDHETGDALKAFVL